MLTITKQKFWKRNGFLIFLYIHLSVFLIVNAFFALTAWSVGAELSGTGIRRSARSPPMTCKHCALKYNLQINTQNICCKLSALTKKKNYWLIKEKKKTNINPKKKITIIWLKKFVNNTHLSFLSSSSSFSLFFFLHYFSFIFFKVIPFNCDYSSKISSIKRIIKTLRKKADTVKNIINVNCLGVVPWTRSCFIVFRVSNQLKISVQAKKKKETLAVIFYFLLSLKLKKLWKKKRELIKQGKDWYPLN